MSELYRKRDFSIPQERLTGLLKGIVNFEPEEGTLFYEMWNECIDIAEKVLETKYFKGIQGGDLDPNAYGSLMVQDAYYCFKGRDAYSAGAAVAPEQLLRDFFNAKCISYDEYNEYYHQTWHVKNADGVIPGPDIKGYADFEAHVAGNLDSPYLLVVMLPCEYLWPWVANTLDSSTPMDSLYRFWVDGNMGEANGANQMANLLEDYRSTVDDAKAKEIFRRAMQYELDVFTSATILEGSSWRKKA